MTTLVALNTRDALIMGCDSLGTVTKKLVNPFDLVEYFEPNAEWKVKVDHDGKPILDDFMKIYGKSQDVPYSHMQHVDKLLSLEPLKMGVMHAGLMAIGDRTVKNLMGEFKSMEYFNKAQTRRYTLRGVSKKLLEFLWGYYSQAYPDERTRPELELMLGGYDKQKYMAGIVRIEVHENSITEPDYDFAVFFGRQTKEIQRLVFGTDVNNKLRLAERTTALLTKYRTLLTRQLKAEGIKINLKSPEYFGDELELFNNWNIEGIDANISAFSEQNAIECVDFLVNIMIKSQQFSTEMPTVGGEVQLAVIKKASGFIYVSKREWRHGDYAVPVKE